MLLKTNAYSVFDKINDFMRPLSTMAQSLISTVFISVVPIFFIYALNIMFLSSPWIKDTVLYQLISFAIGGLLGDVFYHTIPHMQSGHSHDHGHEVGHAHGHEHDHGHTGNAHSTADMENNTIIIVGIVVFFLIEKITHSYLGVEHSHGSKENHKEKKGKV